MNFPSNLARPSQILFPLPAINRHPKLFGFDIDNRKSLVFLLYVLCMKISLRVLKNFEQGVSVMVGVGIKDENPVTRIEPIFNEFIPDDSDNS